jgi:hypothetical protein
LGDTDGLAIPFQARKHEHVAIRSAVCVILTTLGYTQNEFYGELRLARCSVSNCFTWHSLASLAALREEPWAVAYREKYAAGLEAVRATLPEGVFFVPLEVRPLGSLGVGERFRRGRGCPIWRVTASKARSGAIIVKPQTGNRRHMHPELQVIYVSPE